MVFCPEVKAGVMKFGTYNNCMIIPVEVAKSYNIVKGQKLILELCDNGIFIRLPKNKK